MAQPTREAKKKRVSRNLKTLEKQGKKKIKGRHARKALKNLTGAVKQHKDADKSSPKPKSRRDQKTTDRRTIDEKRKVARKLKGK